MNIHKNARLTPKSRDELVRRLAAGQSNAGVAADFGICAKTAAKWLARFKSLGIEGLVDRSSRPRRLRRPTPDIVAAEVISLRRQRLPGKEVALRLNLSPATVSRILKCAGFRMKDIDPAEPVRRYERQRPGEMIHIDIKKLGRFAQAGHRVTGTRQNCRNQGAGWEFAHVAIDDNSRIAFSQIRKDEKKGSAIAFLKSAVAYYKSLGVRIERVMTDNGSCTSPSPSPKLAGDSRSSISAPNPTHQKPMARPSASSKQLSGNGPMPKPMKHQASGPPSCPIGCIATTGIDHMAASVINHPSADSV
jgi:transposase